MNNGAAKFEITSKKSLDNGSIPKYVLSTVYSTIAQCLEG